MCSYIRRTLRISDVSRETGSESKIEELMRNYPMGEAYSCRGTLRKKRVCMRNGSRRRSRPSSRCQADGDTWLKWPNARPGCLVQFPIQHAEDRGTRIRQKVTESDSSLDSARVKIPSAHERGLVCIPIIFATATCAPFLKHFHLRTGLVTSIMGSARKVVDLIYSSLPSPLLSNVAIGKVSPRTWSRAVSSARMSSSTNVSRAGNRTEVT